MKNLKTLLFLLLCAFFLNVGCDKGETPVEGEIIVEGEEMQEVEEEVVVEQEEMEEETPDNPDLDLVGGQGAFTITPGSGIMSGETSVNLRIVFNDFKTQIPNDSLEYRIDWKTNGVYGSLIDDFKETSISDVDGIIYTSNNTEITQGEEKFVATLYSRPKGSDGEFMLNGSALAALSIANDPNKKYYLLTPVYTVNFLANEACTGASDVRNILDTSIYVNKIENAISYSLIITDIVIGPSIYPVYNNRTFPDLTYSWNQANTQYNNTNPQVPNAAFKFSLASNSINTCNPDYSDSVGWVSGTRAIGYLTVTLE